MAPLMGRRRVLRVPVRMRQITHLLWPPNFADLRRLSCCGRCHTKVTLQLFYCSSCLWYIWNSNHILGAHACFLFSLCLLFASVGQALARIIVSLPWTLFTSVFTLLTHRLVLCIDAHCFIFLDLPGDVLAASESALWLDRCNTSQRNKDSCCSYWQASLLRSGLSWWLDRHAC